jgi:uncharacterized protein (TIGR03437 family)
MPRKWSSHSSRLRVMAVLMASVAPSMLYGSAVTFTIKGTLYSGTDFSGVFGFAPQSSLVGQSFTLVYSFDDSKGQESVISTGSTPYESSVTGTNADSPGTATLTIGSGSFTFGVLPGRYPSTTVSSTALRDIVAGQSGSNRVEETVSEFYTGVPNAGAESFVDALVAVQTGAPPMTTDYLWSSGFTYTLTAADKLASRSSGFLVRDETHLPAFDFAFGGFDEDTITVSGPNPRDSVPEPATGTMLGAGLAATGALLHRRRKQGRIRSAGAPARAGFACLIGLGPLLAPILGRAQTYTITTVAGGGSLASGNGDGGPAIDAIVGNPFDVAVDAAGNLYIADSDRIRKVTPNGIITTIAGGGSPADGLGDGGPATAAALQSGAVVVDANGNIYISDTQAPRIRKVDVRGTITTVAGNGRTGFSGDGGPATSAQLSDPMGLATDAAGNVYLADRYNNRIRKVSTDGMITTVAGGGNPASGIGDGGPATSARLSGPYGVAADSAGNLYISDLGNGRIRKVSANGIITTVAGNGTATYSRDGGPATMAGIDSPWHVAVDAAGNLYITERLDPFAQSSGNFVRLVGGNGIISTIAGNGDNTLGGGHTGYAGDGGPATKAELRLPEGIAVSNRGLVYVAQLFSARVRLLTPVTPPVGSPPSINAGGVVSASAFGQFTSIAPGSWIEIFGSNLAGSSRSWAAADFNGVNAPTSLDGTKVTVGGQAAFIDFVSPNQVNAQVPSNAGTGPQPVIVTTAAGTSSASTITVNAQQPGLLAPSSFNIGGKQYAAALFSDGATYVLPAGGVAGLASRRAQPGDSISLYGIGFGAVTPIIAAGQIVQQANTLTLPFHLFFGPTEATVSYAGLAPNAVGLYQFNIVVPNVPASDSIPLTFTLGGISGTQALCIAVQ